MKRLLTLLLVAMMALGACSGALAEEEPLDIVFVCVDMQGAFWVKMMEGAEIAAQDYGVNLQFKSGEGTLEKQISIIENVVLQEVDAIIVDPLDREGIKPALQAAGEAGIPIVTCGNEVDTEWNHCTIYNDVYDVGCITDIVCTLIGEEGKVACVVGAPGSAVSDARQKGFEDTVAKYPNVEAFVLPANWDATVAQQLVTDLLAAEPDMDAIICADSVAYQVAEAADAAGRSDLLITAFTSMDENLPYVEDGSYFLDLLMGPQRIGYWNVAVAVQLARGAELDQKLYLHTAIIANEENAERIRSLGFDYEVITVDEARTILSDFKSEFGPDTFNAEEMKPAV